MTTSFVITMPSVISPGTQDAANGTRGPEDVVVEPQADLPKRVRTVVGEGDGFRAGQRLRGRIHAHIDRVVGLQLPVVGPGTTRVVARASGKRATDGVGHRDVAPNRARHLGSDGRGACWASTENGRTTAAIAARRDDGSANHPPIVSDSSTSPPSGPGATLKRWPFWQASSISVGVADSFVTLIEAPQSCSRHEKNARSPTHIRRERAVEPLLPRLGAQEAHDSAPCPASC